MNKSFEFFHQLRVVNHFSLFYCLIDLIFYLVVLWSLFFELNFFAGVLLLLFIGIQSAYSIVLHLLIHLHLILSTILLILNLLRGCIFSLNHLHCKAFLWCYVILLNSLDLWLSWLFWLKYLLFFLNLMFSIKV